MGVRRESCPFEGHKFHAQHHVVRVGACSGPRVASQLGSRGPSEVPVLANIQVVVLWVDVETLVDSVSGPERDFEFIVSNLDGCFVWLVFGCRAGLGYYCVPGVLGHAVTSLRGLGCRTMIL